MIQEMENELGTDREAALADMRYNFIENVCRDTVNKGGINVGRQRSIKIDSILTHKFCFTHFCWYHAFSVFLNLWSNRTTLK